MPIVVDGKTFETDEEGYLANINSPASWPRKTTWN